MIRLDFGGKAKKYQFRLAWAESQVVFDLFYH